MMNITLVGAGNLATNLAKALFKAGHNIVQVYSRTAGSAKKLAAVVDAEPVNDVHGINSAADVYIIAVKDSVISSLLPDLCHGKDGKLFLHTAGSMGMDVFKGITSRYGVLYPMQTFSKAREVDFKDIPCFIEGCDDSVTAMASELASTVSTNVCILSSADRRTLHLAAVFASNFTNHCYAISSEILSRCGLPFSVMLPLVDEVTSKVHAMSPIDAQTGPAVRYDINVINRQANMLASDLLFKDIYESMSRSIHAMAQQKKEEKHDKL